MIACFPPLRTFQMFTQRTANKKCASVKTWIPMSSSQLIILIIISWGRSGKETIYIRFDFWRFPDGLRKVGIRALFVQWAGHPLSEQTTRVIVCFRGGLCWPKTRALLLLKNSNNNKREAYGVNRVGALLLHQCLHRVIMFGRHMVVIVFIYHPLTEMFIYHPRLILFTPLTPHRYAIFIMIYFSEKNPKILIENAEERNSRTKYNWRKIPTLGFKLKSRAVLCMFSDITLWYQICQLPLHV